MPPSDWSGFAPGVAASAANMGLNLVQGSVSGLINNAFYKRNLRLQVAAQKDLIDYQNQYNSPSAQMQRLAEAGLNPNLVYGSNAPAGTSGNASAPSGVANPGNYNSADVASAMLHIQQAKAQEASIENLRAETRLKNAEAAGKEFYNSLQPELLQLTIDQGRKQIEKLQSDMDLNDSSVQLNMAKKSLAVADEEFRRGEISLQTYRQQQLVAQTMLFVSEKAVNEMRKIHEASSAREADLRGDLLEQQDLNMKIQNLVDGFELRFKQLFYGDDGRMLELADQEFETRKKQLQSEYVQAAKDCGVVGPNYMRWTDFVMNRLEQFSRIVHNIKPK